MSIPTQTGARWHSAGHILLTVAAVPESWCPTAEIADIWGTATSSKTQTGETLFQIKEREKWNSHFTHYLTCHNLFNVSFPSRKGISLPLPQFQFIPWQDSQNIVFADWLPVSRYRSADYTVTRFIGAHALHMYTAWVRYHGTQFPISILMPL